ADDELGQDCPTAAGECTEHVGAGQMLVPGPAQSLAVDGYWFERDRSLQLGLKPGTQGQLEGANIQVRQDAMQGAGAGCVASEAKGAAAPRLVRPPPFGDGQQAPPTAYHAATQK